VSCGADVLAAAYLGELRRCEHRVQQDGVRADLAAREDGVDELTMIAAHDPDHITGGHARFTKPPRQCIRAPIHLVKCGGAFIVDDGDGVGLTDGQRDEAHRRGSSPTLGGPNDANGLVRPNRFEDACPIQHPRHL